MKKIVLLSLILIVIVGLVGINGMAQEKKEPTFGGVATCKACHLSKKSGAQFKVWEKGPHARAYTTLTTEASKKIASEKGIEDPTKADACLKCHVTAHGVKAELIGPKLKVEEGVGCESCHGAGSEYKGRKVMQDIWDGKTDGATLGLARPDEKVCITCHNEESPTYKVFKFEDRVKEIAHPHPEGKKG